MRRRSIAVVIVPWVPSLYVRLSFDLTNLEPPGAPSVDLDSNLEPRVSER